MYKSFSYDKETAQKKAKKLQKYYYTRVVRHDPGTTRSRTGDRILWCVYIRSGRKK